MGMFDHIYCEYPLPDGFNTKGVEFQSKDLDCMLDYYTITADGRLIHHYREWEVTPEAELPHPDQPFFGSLREKAGSQKMVDTNYHGVLNFYSYEDTHVPPYREYDAKFTDGKIVSIVLVTAE